MKRWQIVVLSVLGFSLAGVGGFFLLEKAKQPRVTIRNISAAPLTKIGLKLTPGGYSGKEKIVIPMAPIPIGGAATHLLKEGDFHVELTFEREGVVRKIECGEIGNDWETYIVTIQAEELDSKCDLLGIGRGPGA